MFQISTLQEGVFNEKGEIKVTAGTKKTKSLDMKNKVLHM